MPLVQCPECGKTVSSLASVCPSCGAPALDGAERGDRRAGPTTCPVCRKTLPPNARICMDCNVDARSGRPLALPPVGSATRRPSGSLLLTGLALLGIAAAAYVRTIPSQGSPSPSSTPEAPASAVVPGPSVQHITPKPPEPDLPESAVPVASQASPPAAPPRVLAALEPRPAVSDQKDACSPSAAASASPHRPAPERPRSRRPETALVRAVCPLCAGCGRLVVPGSRRWTYQCPTCCGKGVRTLRVSADAHVCSVCRGMGCVGKLDTFRRVHNRYVAVRCSTCRGTGVCGRAP